MRLAIRISPSRVSSSTVPISRMYMRTGSVVRPSSASSAASAAAASSMRLVVGRRARLARQQRLVVRCLFVHRDAHVVDGVDDAFDLLRIDDLGGQVIIDLRVGQVALLLAARDQQLELRLAVLGQAVAAARVGAVRRRGMRMSICATQRPLPGPRVAACRRRLWRRLFGCAAFVRLGRSWLTPGRRRDAPAQRGALAMRWAGGGSGSPRSGFAGGRGWLGGGLRVMASLRGASRTRVSDKTARSVAGQRRAVVVGVVHGKVDI